MPLLAPVVAPSAPTPPPARVPAKFRRLQLTWTGWDGSQWSLTDPMQAGVFLTQDGVEGPGMPTFNLFSSQSPARPGSRYRGSNAQDRDVYWPLYIYSDESSEAWLALDRAFWRTMHPDKPGVWTVAKPDGASARHLRCRFKECDPSFARDPLAFGWTLYGLTLVAMDPYWYGDLQFESRQADALPPYYGGPTSQPGGVTGGGPPYWLGRGNTLATATINNPGENDEPLLYVIDGPWDAGVSVGIGDDATVYGAAIAEGKSLVIDTHPGLEGAELIDTPDSADFPPGSQVWLDEIRRLYADADTDAFTHLTSEAMGVRVAPGASQPLALSGTGQGSIGVALIPTYARAW